ncbi:inositol polyphosphate multikinase [Condylostylus longicornis]|uniref:inositol polyphosphate multikinase n=1 Tax=Condylostylus longicornis TaxID=2530218 RepID=UPI00244E04D1|nr:inositol polyphosphate multikinase [Condylostylus longicornis]XP_055383317.1 inositol polyphosphate multikinase [Condylostylus longicornis]XP_055383318.1 inositol polyphosphate multikinase [Condylostylus longicornis]
MATENIFHIPPGTVPLDTQVAGHTWGENSVGLLKLKEDASVLKPLGKPECGAREIAFYETVYGSDNPIISKLKNFTAEYKGHTKININGRELDFVKLADLTHNMKEPCIMDIKVGKRTWDPLATPEKIAVEREKYAACKNNLGLCIPGFQIHSITDGKLKRFGKEFGKKLTPHTFKETLRLFLNFDAGICQPLVDDIYKQLKSILKWSSTQTSLKLYSSSILLVYDSKRLKQYLEKGFANNFRTNNSIPNEDILPSHINNKIKHEFISSNNGFVEKNENENNPNEQESYKNGLKAQNKIEMITSKRITNGYHLYFDDNEDDNDNSDDSDSDNHDHNPKRDCLLIENDEINNKSWSHVKMIDFAHAFFNNTDDLTLDTNYLFGVENLVQIFDEFSKEANNI